MPYVQQQEGIWVSLEEKAKEAEWKWQEALMKLAQKKAKQRWPLYLGKVPQKQPYPSHGCHCAPSIGVRKKPHWYWTGMVALCAIHLYQNTELLICKVLFQRIVWEICQEMKLDIRFQGYTMGLNKSLLKPTLSGGWKIPTCAPSMPRG